MSGMKVYFVLYIVLLCELLMVILDRDDAQDAWIQQFKTNASEYHLSFKNNNKGITSIQNEEFSLFLFPSGFITLREQNQVELFVEIKQPGRSGSKIISANGKTSINKDYVNGNLFTISKSKISNSIFVLKFKLNTADTVGNFSIKTWFRAKRELPSYLPDEIKELLKYSIRDSTSFYPEINSMINNSMEKSEEYSFIIKNKQRGIDSDDRKILTEIDDY